LLEGQLNLKRKLAAAEAEIKMLKSCVEEQGGVMIGGVIFRSEAEVRALVSKENPSCSGFASVVDAVSIFAHDEETKTHTDWATTTKKLSGVLTDAERKYIASFKARYPEGYADCKKVEAGTKASGFASVKVWKGVGESPGRCQRMAEAISNAKACLETYAADGLPEGSTLLKVAEASVTATERWLTAVNTHFLNEIETLTDLGIKADEALILCTDQMKIMYDHFYKDRMHAKGTYSADCDNVALMAKAIWVSLKTHSAMADYMEHGLKNHASLASAFVRCLTRKMGGAGGGGSEAKDSKDLAKEAKEAVRAAKEAKEEAKEAREAAKEAGRSARSAESQASKAQDKVDKVVSKNKLSL
jgi:hypothetical protein